MGYRVERNKNIFFYILGFFFLSVYFFKNKHFDDESNKNPIKKESCLLVKSDNNILKTGDCKNKILLKEVENNLSFTYRSSDLIETEANYQINKNSNIILKSGKMIVLRPNTVVRKGARFLGEIKDCDEKNCDDKIIYNKFFTPNQDGINDYWNIKNVENKQNVLVFIYNRYGKLLKQISSDEQGWDGTYNSINLPTSEYWFRASYIDCDNNLKELKSHFTLKR